MFEKILKKYGIKAKKSLGQNFLVNKDKLNFISSFLDIKDEFVVEIGPGFGALTEEILEKNPRVLELVELDTDMVNVLKERVEKGDLKSLETNISIKNIDVLKYSPDYIDYIVIANIPYYITSPIFRHFFYNLENKPKKMLILMQKDVGDRILNGVENGGFKLKNKKVRNSVLSLFLQKKSFIKEVLFVPRNNFIPAPKVDSSVLYFELHDLYNNVDDKIFLDFIKLSFSNPRKKLLKNLLKSYKREDILNVFKINNVGENTRAEELSISSYCKIIGDFNKLLT